LSSQEVRKPVSGISQSPEGFRTQGVRKLVSGVSQSPEGFRQSSKEFGQSPEGFRTLKSLQDPFMESDDGVTMTKTRFYNSFSNRRIKDDSQTQPPQKVDSEAYNNQQYTDSGKRCSPVSPREERESSTLIESQRVTRGSPSTGQTVAQLNSFPGSDCQAASNSDPCLHPDVDQSYRTQTDIGGTRGHPDNSHAGEGRTTICKTIQKSPYRKQTNKTAQKSPHRRLTSSTAQKSPNRRPPKSRVKCISYQLQGKFVFSLSIQNHHVMGRSKIIYHMRKCFEAF
jgi:hypothetical protein